MHHEFESQLLVVHALFDSIVRLRQAIERPPHARHRVPRYLLEQPLKRLRLVDSEPRGNV